ncbi:MAG: lmo0937 family membrane protein [Gemmatimonadales bacterium]|nr:MAG: lmo0937 family membrane protein [Gemmatimonadales bacterium]
MIWTIVVILLILWLVGLSTAVVGNLIHILLVLAIVAILFRVISGGRTAV